MKVSFTASPKRAFTLIELVISSALMVIILAGAYACFAAGLSSRRVIESRSEAVQSARVALGMIAADLRSAVPLSKEFEFVGMRRDLNGRDADNLDFATRNYTPRRAYEADFCEVSYFVQPDPETKSLTLFRRRDATRDPEPLSGGSNEEIARGVTGLRFEFHDGYDWYDEWGDPTGKEKTKTLPDPNVSGLPEAVKITLTVDPAFERKKTEEADSEEPPLVLQTIARINMSLFFYRAGGGSGGATNTASDAQRPTGTDQ